MKKFGIFIALAIMATFSFAQNGNGNNETFNISSVKTSPGIGDMEILEIHITRPGVSQISGMFLDFGGMRAASYSMTKVATEINNAPGNSGNNANDVWVVTLDLDQYADGNGYVTAQLRDSFGRIRQMEDQISQRR